MCNFLIFISLFADRFQKNISIPTIAHPKHISKAFPPTFRFLTNYGIHFRLHWGLYLCIYFEVCLHYKVKQQRAFTAFYYTAKNDKTTFLHKMGLVSPGQLGPQRLQPQPAREAVFSFSIFLASYNMTWPCKNFLILFNKNTCLWAATVTLT